jgi:NTE family protein
LSAERGRKPAGFSAGPYGARLGLVLAGGAARGAYEAGVLRYIYVDLARRLGFAPWPDLVSGTSVGALMGSFVAGRDVDGLDWLCRTWREMRIPQVYEMSYWDLLKTLRTAFGSATFALVDARPMYELVIRHWPRLGLRRAVEQDGVVFIVGATDLHNGQQVLFMDARDPPTVRTRHGIRVVHTRIRSRHALASAALPILFPPIPLGGTLFVDGGLRMNTPLAPVLRAGANRALVIGVKRKRTYVEPRDHTVPNLPFLVGKTLNALLLDPIEQDLAEAENVNELLRWGTDHFGPAFAEGMNRDFGLHQAEILYVTPTEDLGAVAADVYKHSPPLLKGPISTLLQRAAGRDAGPDADLLSYIFFDRAYTGTLERLGWEDARRQEEEIARLVAPPDDSGVTGSQEPDPHL